MDVVSTYKYARISAQKARDVAREIQGLSVSAALDILAFTPRKGARLFEKTMKAAIADAEHNFELPVDNLFVKEAVVGEAPSLKRVMPRARGSASGIIKRSSHLRVVLSNELASEPKEKKRHLSAERQQGGKQAQSQAKTKTKEGATQEKKTPVDLDKGSIYDEIPDHTDELSDIPQIGAKLAEKLNSEGIYTYEQIANWTPENERAFEQILSLGDGQIKKEKWVKAAKKLLEEQSETEEA